MTWTNVNSDKSVWDPSRMGERVDKWNALNKSVDEGETPDWAAVAEDDPFAWETTRSSDDRVEGVKTPRDAYNEWLRKQLRANLGADSKDAALAYGMQPGAGKWADDEAAAWGATAAPDLYNASGMRSGRGALLDAMLSSSSGGLASDVQSKIRREAAALAAARSGQNGSQLLSGAQGQLAERGMGDAAQERAARYAAYGKGIGEARGQEFAEAKRMQDWMLQREALRQKLLGRGLAQKQRRFDLLQRGWTTENALDMGEMQLQQQASAADMSRQAGYLKSGGELLGALTNAAGKGGGGEYEVGAESAPMEEESWIDSDGNKYSDY